MKPTINCTSCGQWRTEEERADHYELCMECLNNPPVDDDDVNAIDDEQTCANADYIKDPLPLDRKSTRLNSSHTT
jgi:hypothetical protein